MAATAMAYSSGGGQHHHQDEAPDPAHLAQNPSHQGGAGGDTLETQQNTPDGGVGDLANNGPPPGPLTSTGGAPGGSGGSYGPGDGNDNGGSGFMPNGEDGLMILADFARTQGEGAGSGGAPGNDGAGGGAGGGDFGAGSGGGLPGGEGGDDGKVAGDGAGSGFGLPGGGSGGGGGGGFGGGGGGGGGPGPTGGAPGLPNGGATHICPASGVLECGPPSGGPHPPASPVTVQTGNPATNGPFTDNGPHVNGPPNNGPPNNGPPSNPDRPVTGGAGPVPEPAAWLMMILGFGALGQSLRARRRILA